MNVFRLFGEISINRAQAEADIKGVGATAQAQGSTIESSFAKAGAAIVAALGIRKLVSEFKQLLSESVAAASTFESQMTEVAKVTDPETANSVGAAIRDLALEMPIATEKLMDIAAAAGRMGIEGKDNILEFTTAVAKIGVATDVSADEAATAFAKILKATGAATSDMEKLGSAINTMSNNMATSAQEIVDNMQRSANALSGLGMTTPEIVAIAAALNEVSESADRAGTALKTIAEKLKDPAKMKELAEALSITIDEFRKLRDENPVELFERLSLTLAAGGEDAEALYGILGESASRLASLGTNWESVETAVRLANEQYQTATSLQEEYNLAADDFASKAQTLRNHFTEMKIQIGNELIPALEDMVAVFKDNKEGIADFFVTIAGGIAKTFVWIIDNKEMLAGALAAVLAGLLAFQAYNWVTAFNPISAAFTAIGVAAAGVGAAIGGITKRLREAREVAEGHARFMAELEAEANARESSAASAREVNKDLSVVGFTQTGNSLGVDINAGFDTRGFGVTSEDIAAAEKAAEAARAAREEQRRLRQEAGRKWWQGLFWSEEVDEAAGTTITSLTEFGATVSDTLNGIFSSTITAYLDQQEAHEEAMQAIRDAEQESLDEAKRQRDEDLASLKDQLDQKLVSQEEYEAQSAAINQAYTDQVTSAAATREEALKTEEKTYKETKKSLWEILKESVKNVLKALKEELALKAAAALAEAIALTLGLSPLAGPKYLEAAAYGAGAAGLMIAGFEKGGVVKGPTLGVIGEGQNDEAILPLSRDVFAGIGRGIAGALATMSPSPALAGANGIQIDMRGLYDGAVINVRDDQDITRIARETHDLWQSRMRARGYAV